MNKNNYSPIMSKLIYNLGNNLVTIGSLEGGTDILNRYENFFVGEVMNEITHLPYDSMLLQFLKKLSIETDISNPEGVRHLRVWDIKNSYLNEDRDGHMDGLSVQPDTSIILDDYIVFFEFKKPHTAPSQNKMTLQELGRQILLAIKHSSDYNIDNYKAPYIYYKEADKYKFIIKIPIIDDVVYDNENNKFGYYYEINIEIPDILLEDNSNKYTDIINYLINNISFN